MKKNKKLNEGCLKVFKFLDLLYNDTADYEAVFEIFRDESEDQTNNNIQVNINKYINTLKIFGLKIKKEKKKYKLLSSLYAMNFSIDDLKSINLLETYIKNLPNIEHSKNVNDVLQLLELRMNSEDKKTLNELSQDNKHDFSFYYSDIREQIQECERICKENFAIHILYKKNGEDINCKCNPKEVIYDSKTAYLKVYHLINKQNIEIPISNILSITKTPQRANPVEMTSTVVYKLKNKLAKRYKLKDNETSKGFDEDGNQIIVNKDESIENLISRLLRYSFDCEIISPKHIREEMKRVISETISQYEE